MRTDKVLILILGLGMALPSCAEQSHHLPSPDGTGESFPAAKQADPVYRETEVRLSRPRLNGEVFDPQESDPAFKDRFAIADRQAERAVEEVTRDSKFIFHFWHAKKRILKHHFGIQWRTPAELNPGIVYSSYGQPEITDAENRILRALTEPQLGTSSEEIRGVTRSFEGVASVWTREKLTGQKREYRYTGHNESWTFIEVRKWEV